MIKLYKEKANFLEKIFIPNDAFDFSKNGSKHFNMIDFLMKNDMY